MLLYFILGLLAGLLIATSVAAYFYSIKNASLSATKRELELVRTESNRQATEYEQRFQQQMALVRESLETTTQKMLDESRDKLTDRNRKDVGDLTQPLREAIRDMRTEMANNSRETARQTAGLSAEIKILAEASQKVGERAQALTAALRGEVKKQGNWGELILTTLLEREGLKDGVEFTTQKSLRDALGSVAKNAESGSTMLPDAILHYPNQQDVIIDAKVSLNAFYNYLQATDDVTRENALRAHVKSVREQFLRLSKKNYSEYVRPPRQAVEFVVMFVPNESALQLALDSDSSLWYDAFDKHVLIAGEHNLAAILRIVGIAWRQFKQTENQQRVFQVASELLDRLGDFAQRYAKVGETIERLQGQFDHASKKLVTGQQSVAKKGNELKELGAKENPSRPIPPVQLDADDLISPEK
ncbi:MAG: DNA recombination protein RmuC [Alloprevotella sp.]|nr:DNA recombination protein RmuC [Alloprevotella sp.]